MKKTSKIKPVSKSCPLEHEEQAAFVLRCNHFGIPAFAIPNGGFRNVVTASRLKAEGVSPGVPDMMIPVPANGKHGLFVEMKRRRGGTVTPQQQEWHDLLRKQGYTVSVARGCDEAIDALNAYLRGEI